MKYWYARKLGKRLQDVHSMRSSKLNNAKQRLHKTATMQQSLTSPNPSTRNAMSYTRETEKHTRKHTRKL